MSFPRCPVCGSELGPWEASACLAHHAAQPGEVKLTISPYWTIGDLAVVALERESAPVSIYDVQRAISRDLGRSVMLQSVTALMGADRRFCWSGKGLYGLFRHNRVPMVRTLSGVSRVLMAAYDEPLRVSDLCFVLKWSGYRFQDTSLEAALLRDARDLGYRFSWSNDYNERIVRLIGARDVRRTLGRDLATGTYSAQRWPSADLLSRWQARLEAGIAERQRRLDDVGGHR